MAIGPIVGGIGLLLLTRVGADPDYVPDVLPGCSLFGLGLSATVAPLTATALNSVEERHVGVASGINNGVSRVAGLLAIAMLGRGVAGSSGPPSTRSWRAPRSQPGRPAVVEDAKSDPLRRPDTEGLADDEAEQVEEASVSRLATDGFHLGMTVGGILMIAGSSPASGSSPSRRGEERAARPAAVRGGERS